jgi:elongation factor 1-alpha
MDAFGPFSFKRRYEEIVIQLSSFLMKVGYKPGELQFVPISGFKGYNLIERSTDYFWYKGPTLFEALDRINEPKRLSDMPLRLPLQGVYKIGGIGTVAAGCVRTGVLKPGMLVTFAPTGLQGEVTSVQMDHADLSEALPGDNVGFAVKNVSDAHLRRGYVASSSNHQPAKEATNFTSKVIITSHPGRIGNGYTPVLNCHTSHIAVRFAKLLAKMDKFSDKVIEKEPKFLKKGDVGIIQMIPTKPMVVETYYEYPSLGRFVVRDMRQTVAVGIILTVNKNYPCERGKIIKSTLKKQTVLQVKCLVCTMISKLFSVSFPNWVLDPTVAGLFLFSLYAILVSS